MQVQGSAPYTCARPQEQHGQGQHLLPGAQLPHGGRDTRLLGELARDHRLVRGQQLTRHTGVPASTRPSCVRSLPTATHRCRSCCRPWAASGACGLAHLSSPSWNCWSCCSTPQPSACYWAAVGSAALRGPSRGCYGPPAPRQSPPRDCRHDVKCPGAQLAMLPGALAGVSAEE